MGCHSLVPQDCRTSLRNSNIHQLARLSLTVNQWSQGGFSGHMCAGFTEHGLAYPRVPRNSQHCPAAASHNLYSASPPCPTELNNIYASGVWILKMTQATILLQHWTTGAEAGNIKRVSYLNVKKPNAPDSPKEMILERLYLEGQRGLVSRLITPITNILTLIIPIINLLTKSP